MRFVLGLLSALLGLVAGWFGLALAVIGFAGPDRDGGIAMGAFFQIGPIGGVAGFFVGLWLFRRFGLGRAAPVPSGSVAPPASGEAAPAATPAEPAAGRAISRPFAIAVIALAAGLGWWGWYEFVRSPYLSHGFLTLEMRFRLPAGMAPPASRDDVAVLIEDDDRQQLATVPESWRAQEGERTVVSARTSLYTKARRRLVILTPAGGAEAVWRLDLAVDPEPFTDFTPWRGATGADAGGIEMSYRLSAER